MQREYKTHSYLQEICKRKGNVMKISEALYVAGGHLRTGKQCHLKEFGINTISGPFEFKQMVHESSNICNMLYHVTQIIK
jgi:hypothetical protein